MSEIKIDIEDTPTITPTLFDINKSFDVLKSSDGRYTGLRGEEEARMVLFTNFVLGEKPVILKGSRASGKTNTMEVVARYCRNPIVVASSSEKAFQRNSNLNSFSHFIIPEVNKIQEKTIEMLKDFGEGASHNYTFLNSYKEPETILISPKPFVTSIADENKNVNALGEELLSRLTVVRTDSSVQQNINVIEEKLKHAENPFRKKDISQSDVEEYVQYVHSLPSITNFRFIYPAGTAVRSAIPPLFTDSRRDIDKYLSNTYGITLFYYGDRIKQKIDGYNYLFVTPADMWYNHIIYQNILLESSLKCGRMEKEILEILKEYGDEVKTDDWGNKVKGMKVNEIHSQLIQRSYTPTIDAVRKYCDGLMEIGYVTRNEEARPYRYLLNPELQREYKVNINWKEIVLACETNMKKNFPKVADEYIRRFCRGDGLIVVHPFTGDKINILEDVVIDEEEVAFKEYKNNIKTDKVLDNKDPILVELDTLTIGEDNDTDMLQNKLLEVMENGKTYTMGELFELTEADTSDIYDTLQYLKKIGEVFEDKNKYGVLK